VEIPLIIFMEAKMEKEKEFVTRREVICENGHSPIKYQSNLKTPRCPYCHNKKIIIPQQNGHKKN